MTKKIGCTAFQEYNVCFITSNNFWVIPRDSLPSLKDPDFKELLDGFGSLETFFAHKMPQSTGIHFSKFQVGQ